MAPNKTTGGLPTYRFYPRIGARITIPFLLTVVFISGIGVFIVTRLVAGSIQERLNNQLMDSARAAQNAIVEIENQQLATLRLMAFTEGVSTAIQGNDTASLDRLLRPIAANAGADDVIVFDRAGRALFQLRRLEGGGEAGYSTPAPPEVWTWNSVQRVITGDADRLGDKFVDLIQEEGEHRLYISAPVIDINGEGELVGGISLGITALRFSRRISEQSLSEVLLYDNNGAIIGSTFRATPAEQLTLHTTQVVEFAVAMQNTITPIEERFLSGTPYQLLYAPLLLRSQPLGLIAVGLPTHFVTERIGTSRDTFALLFSLLFVSVVLLGIVVTRSIIEPIRQLVNTTRAIRQGDLSRRVGLRTPDELGELSVSFDHMTDQLVRRNRQISRLYMAQLEETARRDAVLASINDAVFVLNPTGKAFLLNRAARTLIETLHPNEAAYQQLVALCQHPQQLTEAQTVILDRRYYSVLAEPVTMPSGDLLGHVVVFHDITALMEIERVKDEMILQLSHELRTPLTAARGYVELLHWFNEHGELHENNGFVHNALTHLTTLERMVNQVVDVSALVANKFTIDIDEFNLADLLRKTIEEQKPHIQERELRLTVRILPSADCWMTGDPSRLAQVVEHLLRNAYSYTLPGGCVEVSAGVEEGRAVITVADSGVGIEADELDKVFERMYRGRSAEAGPTDTRGLGLGLYLSRQFVEAHQGTISLESQPGRGTTVTVELPTRQGVPQ